MNDVPTPPPAVIGSGMPHTVSLKPGSNVAASQTARPRDEDPHAGLTERSMARLRRGQEAGRGKRQVPPQAAPRATPGEAGTAAAPVTVAGLGSAVQQRIAQLRQRNEAVSSELDRLSTAGRRAR
ncbi:MAG: hypothetical protein RIS88_2878 [Pseudomonadota bacterium]|jgi:hypothetical protein